MSHPDARFIESLDKATEWLQSRLRRGDVLFTLGAGDVNRVGMMLQEHLQGERNV
jgi:UDP-N-acetylmuramate-alanine ligase